MASDAYLQLDGIKGESQDNDHKEWIEIVSFNFGVIQPRSACASSSGGHTAERCEHQPITLTRLSDAATPKLLEQSSTGGTIKKGIIHLMRADGDRRVKYFELEMYDLLIAGIFPCYQPGATLGETVSIAYSRVVWRYTVQKVTGGSGGNVMGGYDLSKNTKFTG